MEEERHAKRKVLEWINKTRAQQQETPVGLTSPRNGHVSRRQGSQARPGRSEAPPAGPGRTSTALNARTRPNGGAGKEPQTEEAGKNSFGDWMGLASERREGNCANAPTQDFDLLSALRASPVADLLSVGGIGIMFSGLNNEEPGISVADAEQARGSSVLWLGPNGEPIQSDEPRALPNPPRMQKTLGNVTGLSEPEWIVRAQQARRRAKSLTQSDPAHSAGSHHP
jgi:hypothetical protein